MALTAKDVIENVTTLESDFSLFRLENQKRTDLYGLYSKPNLPADLARKSPVYLNDPTLINLAKALRAFLMTFQTEIACKPTARDLDHSVPQDDQRKADNLEKADAIWWNRINPNRELEENTIWRQLVQPTGIVVLECGAVDQYKPAERFPWRAFDVDIDGCGWMVNEGVPTVFGRHYKRLLYQVQQEYSRRRGTEHEGADLYVEDGKVSWKPASDDYSPTLSRRDSKGFPEVECHWYDDGAEIVHVALNAPGARWNIGPARFGTSNDRDGEILWRGPNPFGRVSAFLAPGNKTPLRQMQDSMEPFMLEVMVTIAQLNDIMSTWATAARNRAAPRDYVKADPESYALYLQRNAGQELAIQWADGKTPVLPGEVLERPVNVDPYTEKLAQMLLDRLNRFLPPEFSTLRDPDIMKQATLGAQLAAYDSGARFVSPVIGHLDTMRRQMVEAYHHSVKHIAEHDGAQYARFEMAATAGGAVNKQLGDNEMVLLDAAALDFPHEIRVRSYSNTQAQLQTRYEIVRSRFEPLPNGLPGPGIYQDLWDAIDEPDPTARIATLADEAIEAEFVQPWVKSMVELAMAEEVEKDSGIILPPPAGTVPPPVGGGGAGGGVSGSFTRSPATEQVEGGGSPPMVA